jgi:hypothetical protein
LTKPDAEEVLEAEAPDAVLDPVPDGLLAAVPEAVLEAVLEGELGDELLTEGKTACTGDPPTLFPLAVSYG